VVSRISPGPLGGVVLRISSLAKAVYYDFDQFTYIALVKAEPDNGIKEAVDMKLILTKFQIEILKKIFQSDEEYQNYEEDFISTRDEDSFESFILSTDFSDCQYVEYNITKYETLKTVKKFRFYLNSITKRDEKSLFENLISQILIKRIKLDQNIENLIEKIRKSGSFVGGYATTINKKYYENIFFEDMERRNVLFENPDGEELLLAKIKIEDFGFDSNVTLSQIYKKAKKFGLDVCPNLAAFQLRSEYVDQQIWDSIKVATKPYKSLDGDSKIFRIYHGSVGKLIELKSRLYVTCSSVKILKNEDFLIFKIVDIRKFFKIDSSPWELL